ncbi:MAG: radical SAM protein [Candidatus Omnitrophota bacterium]|mgnify:CR=1 FL=1
MNYDIYDVEVDWHINDFCNFECIYCLDKKDKKSCFIGPKDIDKVVNNFNKTGLTWLIGFTGGEPFFVPDFVKLCDKLCRQHIVSINTNLSHKDIFRFAETIKPEKVSSIHCSLHIEERERLNLVQDFIGKYQILQKKGFCVFASYLMYPYLINRFENDYNYFKSKGIILWPKVFKGMCTRFKLMDSRFFKKIMPFFSHLYPNAYSKQEQEKIKSYIERSQSDSNSNITQDENLQRLKLSDIWFDRFCIQGLPDFKGRYCNAGSKFVIMTSMGDIYRCYGDKQYLGNLYDGQINLFDAPKKCSGEICRCASMGYKYVLESNEESKILCQI